MCKNVERNRVRNWATVSLAVGVKRNTPEFSIASLVRPCELSKMTLEQHCWNGARSMKKGAPILALVFPEGTRCLVTPFVFFSNRPPLYTVVNSTSHVSCAVTGEFRLPNAGRISSGVESEEARARQKLRNANVN